MKMHIMRLILCLLIFFYQYVYCYAQIDSTNCSVIEIGIGKDMTRIHSDDLLDCGSVSSRELDYYKLDAFFSVIGTKRQSDFLLVDVKIDSVVNESPQRWTSGIENLTICIIKDDSEQLEVETEPSNRKIRLKLQSFYSINFIGHGEDYYLIKNNTKEEFIKIPSEMVKNNLMHVINYYTH